MARIPPLSNTFTTAAPTPEHSRLRYAGVEVEANGKAYVMIVGFIHLYVKHATKYDMQTGTAYFNLKALSDMQMQLDLNREDRKFFNACLAVIKRVQPVKLDTIEPTSRWEIWELVKLAMAPRRT